ncbi:MAG: chain-length determining protein, partial [Muribaculaceae bacterium]|nr:chain-length determining protein [Muribaculaceae bacterium]
MAEENNNNAANAEESEVDILELGTKLWAQRRKLIIWSICGAILGLVVAFSIPREYSTTVKLAPETNDPKANSSGGLGALASMAGINIGSGSGVDAVYP